MANTPDSPPRITMRYLAGEILRQLNLEKGLGLTIKLMLIRPEAAIKEYLYTDRHRLMKPLSFLLLLVTLAALLSHYYLPAGKEVAQALGNDPAFQAFPAALQEIVLWLGKNMQRYFNLFYLCSLPGLVIGCWIVFRAKGYNLAEQLVINAYIFGMQTLIYLLFLPISFKHEKTGLIFLFLFAAYIIYAYKRIFGLKLIHAIGYTLVVSILSQAVQSFIILLLVLAVWGWMAL